MDFVSKLTDIPSKIFKIFSLLRSPKLFWEVPPTFSFFCVRGLDRPDRATTQRRGVVAVCAVRPVLGAADAAGQRVVAAEEAQARGALDQQDLEVRSGSAGQDDGGRVPGLGAGLHAVAG